MNLNDSVFSQFNDISESFDKIFVTVNRNQLSLTRPACEVIELRQSKSDEEDLKIKSQHANDYLKDIKTCLIDIEVLMLGDSLWKSQSSKVAKLKVSIMCKIEKPMDFMVANSCLKSLNYMKFENLNLIQTNELTFQITGKCQQICSSKIQTGFFSLIASAKFLEENREHVETENPNSSFALPPAHATYDMEDNAENMNTQSAMKFSAAMTELEENMEEGKYEKKNSPAHFVLKAPSLMKAAIKDNMIMQTSSEEFSLSFPINFDKHQSSLFKVPKSEKVKSLQIEIYNDINTLEAEDIIEEDDTKNINLPIFKKYKQSFSMNKATVSTISSPTNRMNSSIISKQINFSVHGLFNKNAIERARLKGSYSVINELAPKKRHKKMLNFFDYHRKDLSLFKLDVSCCNLILSEL